ncbi:MAG: zinc ribbon domain-containing protein [Methanoregulaceae archaeon]|nr:zinc ribbon domain-containing protein [Methanoregulaceae archaeon]
MPFCQDCGAMLKAGSKFCTDCGAPVLDVPGSGPAVLAAGESAQSPTGAEEVIASSQTS